MQQLTPTPTFDPRFSDPRAVATLWATTAAAVEEAELFWITTVRVDGRPHVTPLIAVAHDGALHFTTGLQEQKGRNLEHSRQVALTTGANRWNAGLDVVVEGEAVRVVEPDALQRLAEAFLAKYGEAWRFDVRDEGFGHGDGPLAAVFRVEPAKVLAFAKQPHGQTTYRF